MGAEVIRVGKKNRPLETEVVVNELTSAFPDLQCVVCDEDGCTVQVRRSPFAGARLRVGKDRIELAPLLPSAYGRLLNLVLLGTIQAATAPKLIGPLKRHLRRRFAN